MARVDSFLFLFNGDPISGAVVLKESDASFVGHFLEKGNGFGECRNPTFMGYNGDTIWVYETSVPRRMNYLCSMKDDSVYYKCIEDFYADDRNEFYRDMVCLDNRLCVGKRLIGEKRPFALLTNRLDTLQTFGNLPIGYKGKTLHIFNGSLLADGDIVYFAMRDYAYLCAYRVKERKVETLFERLYVKPEILDANERVVYDKEKHLLGFYDMTYFKDYLLVTYSGKPFAAQKKGDELMPTCIILLDRKGKPLHKFDVPVKIRSIIASDEDLFILDLDCNIYTVKMDELLRHLV